MTTYVYAVVRAGHPLGDEPPAGVGEPAAAVRVLTEGRLSAVVSDAPEGLRAKRRDLLAHQQVMERLLAAGPVLPMRFGSLADDDTAVRKVLHQRAAHFEERLRELEGRVEVNVKAAHDEQRLLRAIVADDPRIRELNERTRAGGPDAQQDRIRLGELVAAAVRERQERDAALVREALAPLAAAESPAPQVGEYVCNHSFLVDGSALDGFRSAAERLEKENGHLRVRVNGPLPPYSFVETGEPAKEHA